MEFDYWPAYPIMDFRIFHIFVTLFDISVCEVPNLEEILSSKVYLPMSQFHGILRFILILNDPN